MNVLLIFKVYRIYKYSELDLKFQTSRCVSLDKASQYFASYDNMWLANSLLILIQYMAN